MTYSQEEKYEYSDFSSTERFILKSDSFVYIHKAGLIYGEINGTINYVNDTLIFNSNFQPSFTLDESLNTFLDKDTIAITIKDFEFPHHYGLRVHKKKKYYDIDFQDSSLVRVEYDSIGKATTFCVASNFLSRRAKLYFILYRTNLRIKIDWKNKMINKHKLTLNNLPHIVDYHFFTNKKAVIQHGDLILLDKEGKPETTYYTIRRNEIISVSKKKIIKKYKKII